MSVDSEARYYIREDNEKKEAARLNVKLTLRKIEVNNFPNDRLEVVIRAMIIDLENRKYKVIQRSDTDDFCLKIEGLLKVLFVLLQ